MKRLILLLMFIPLVTLGQSEKFAGVWSVGQNPSCYLVITDDSLSNPDEKTKFYFTNFCFRYKRKSKEIVIETSENFIKTVYIDEDGGDKTYFKYELLDENNIIVNSTGDIKDEFFLVRSSLNRMVD
tara:strand:- start:217 stop:597 length:381 start_codon:yes stop_codon:yes gene_type:complete